MTLNFKKLVALAMVFAASAGSAALAQDRAAEAVGSGQIAELSATGIQASSESDAIEGIAIDQPDRRFERATETRAIEAQQFEDIPEGFQLVEGDIVMPVQPEGPAPRFASEPNLWPNGIVPYVFDAAVTTTNRNAMIAAMGEWEAVADIDFRPRTNQADYVYIQNSSGNNSRLGRVGGRQIINIYNWSYRFIMAHELAHTLGVWHEQSRADRDTYVEIVTSNIESGFASQFDKHPNARLTGTYDFESIMHYGSCAFSECSGCSASCYTIRARPTYADRQSLMGNRDHLSAGDIANMRTLYGAPPVPLVPDLIVEEIVVSNTTIDLNQTFSAQVRIANRGNGAAGAFELTAWLNSNPVACPQVRNSVSGLAAGATTTLNFNNLSYTTDGTKTFSAFVDVCDVVSETNENNNTRSLTLTVFDFPQLDVPVMVSATAGERSIALTWNAVAGATGYKVFYDEDSSNPPFSPASLATEGASGLDVGNATSFTLTGLPVGQIYYVAVKAYDNFSESEFSNQLTATPYTLIPLAPVLVSATGGDRTVTLQWNAVAGANGYRVYYDEDEANPPYYPTKTALEGAPAIDVGNATQFTLTGFPSNYATRVAVTAYNTFGESDFSNEISTQTIRNIPAVPTLMSVVGGDQFVSIYWQAAAGATGYRVYYDEDVNNPPYTPERGSAPFDVGNVTSIRITGLAASQRYYIAVTAYNADGESGYSNELSDRTANPPPPPTTSSTGSSGSGSGDGDTTPPPAGATTTGTGDCTTFCGLLPCGNMMLMVVGVVGMNHLRRQKTGRRIK